MTEEKLLRRLRIQDARALEALIDQYNAYVVSIVSAVLGETRRQEDVEELVSDVFLAVWNHAGAITPGKLRPYIGMAARNTAKSFLRKNRILTMDLDEIPALPSGQTPESGLLQKEQKRLVRQAIEGMPEKDREIFLRYYYYCQTSAQIAEKMGMEDSTVRVRLMRGRDRLKQTLCKEDII